MDFKSQINMPIAPAHPTEVTRQVDVLPVLMTHAEYVALEDPPGSGLYPSLKGKRVILTDVDTRIDSWEGMMPDYANQETVDLFGEGATSFVASRTGWYYLTGLFYDTGSDFGGTDLFINITVGGKTVAVRGRENIPASPGVKDYRISVIAPAVAGDVIHIGSNGTPTGNAVFQRSAYFIPPKVVSIAQPVVSEDWMNVAMVPDYANMESTNRIATENVPWTVEQAGFIYFGGTYHSGGDPIIFSINGKTILNDSNEMSISEGYSNRILPVKQGDVVLCVSGYSNVYCHFIPPLFVTTHAPVVSDDFMNVAMVPDYANVETINRITKSVTSQKGNFYGWSWTADRVGFATCYLTSNTVGPLCIGLEPASKATTWASHSTNLQQTIPVSPGDWIFLNPIPATNLTDLDKITAVGIHFIPPKFITTQAPNIVVSGASYSTTEVATGETWIDGKPIYRRVFSGGVSAAANTPSYITLAIGGFDNLVASGGWINYSTGSSDKFSINGTIDDGSTIGSSNVYIHTNNLLMFSKCNVARTTANHHFQFWAEYTKTTD
jgi:hypothetical protein